MCQLFHVDEETTIALLRIQDYRHTIDMEIIPREQTKRIEKLKNEHDRIKKLVARTYLFQYCKKHYSLEDFSFVYGEHCRPSFRNSALSFSFSYSKDMVAIALSTKDIVGHDIEFLDDSLVSRSVACEFMTSEELMTFSLLEREEQAQFFYQVWTGKESFLKAHGVGLTIDTKTITCELGLSFFAANYVMSLTQLATPQRPPQYLHLPSRHLPSP